MKRRTVIATIVLCIIATGLWLINERSKRIIAPAISPQQIAMIATGSLTFEKQHGQILVWIIDAFGDSHGHVLQSNDMPETKAIELLEAKQRELEKRNSP